LQGRVYQAACLCECNNLMYAARQRPRVGCKIDKLIPMAKVQYGGIC